MARKVLLVAAGLSVLASPVMFGQINAAAGDKQREFEVASIRPHPPGERTAWFDFKSTPDGVNATGITLLHLIQNAYGVRNFPSDDRVIGVPDWGKSEEFDVHAKMADADFAALEKLSEEQQAEQRRVMLQALLVDRFKLKVHRESRERPVYALVVAKSGPKMKEAKPGDTYSHGLKGEDGKPAAGGTLYFIGNGATAQAFSMLNLANFLTSSDVGLERPVVDKTGLTGTYDFTLLFRPEQRGLAQSQESEDSKPSIFTALQEQLGLRLEPTKGAVEFLVVDHIERPSEN